MTPERAAKIATYERNRLPFAVAVINMSKEMNIGSLLRTAHAAAVEELVLVGDPSFNTYAAATAERWTPITFLPSPGELVARTRARGQSLVVIEKAARSVNLFEAVYPSRPVFVLGAEKFGVPGEVLDAAALIVEIPQWGLVPSLNVAAAGSVVIYDYLAKLCGARTAVAPPADLTALRRLAEPAP